MANVTASSPLYSCVMADAPIFAQQTLTLVWTLTDLADVDPGRIIVHALRGSDRSVRRQLDALGVRTVDCEPFDVGHPHCNKLRQLEDADLTAAAPLILCDTDLAFVAPIDDILATVGAKAKAVDRANPPLDTWMLILAAAGFPTPPPLTRTTLGGDPTPAMNCNGGLYLLSPSAISGLRNAWPRWARWLINRPDLLQGSVRVHIDQVAFGLAATELALPVELLTIADNYPTHVAAAELPNVTPRILHYHQRVDASGFLLPVSLPAVDLAIARVHEVIRRRRRDTFDNGSFWDFRYHHSPDLGSGLGSRGAALDDKRSLLARHVAPSDALLDVGCGDLEVSRGLSVGRYTGVDVSHEAIATARAKRPDWLFHSGDLRDLPVGPHDVVVCFDVLIHQRTLAAYRSLASQLVRLATRKVIVSGYNQPPWHTSEMTFFHEPLTTTLGRLAGTGHLELIGGYRDATVVTVDVKAASAQDSIAARLRGARARDTPHGRMMSLEGDLISAQFDAFGAHTRNELAMLLSFLRPGDAVLDVGAHIGSFAVPIARRVGPSGLVIAIEPDDLNLELLYENVAANAVGDEVVIVRAIAGEPTVPLRAVEEITNTGAWHFVPDVSATAARTAQTVDEIASATLGQRRVRLVKVDVEGMEPSALRSAHATIAASRPLIYCEVAAQQLARQGVAVADLDRFFAERRYVLYRNIGDRNSTHDAFTIARLPSLEAGGAFFDVLAVPAEEVAGLTEHRKLPGS
ncbi:MAG: class I SAM-dependent methyltransferase [Acidobacteriota bacterium]